MPDGVSDTALAIQYEEHVEPERWADEGALDNGVRIFEQRVPRYSTAPKYPKFTGYLSDFYARCDACGWTDHQPTLPVIRRHAKKHPCQVQSLSERSNQPDGIDS